MFKLDLEKAEEPEIKLPTSAVSWKKQEFQKNSRMGKTIEISSRKRDTKGTFHAKMSTIKERNSKDLTEAEEIKKSWQEYTELYKKGLNDPDNHSGVVIHLEPDILDCEVQ